MFRRFLLYYSRFGCFDISVDFHSETSKDLVKRFVDIAERFDVTIGGIHYGVFNIDRDPIQITKDFLRKNSHSDSWKVVVDSDEFVDFGGSPVTLFRALESRRENVLVGHLLERVRRDLFPISFENIDSLDRACEYAFPLCRIVRRGWSRKVIAFRGNFTQTAGHHYLEEEGRQVVEIEQDIMNALDAIRIRRLRNLLSSFLEYMLPENCSAKVKRSRVRLTVHHFGWSLGVIERSRRRIAHHSDCAPEFERLIEFSKQPIVTRRHLLCRVGELGI